MTTTSRELPKYKCHKEVWALKIKSVSVPLLHKEGTTPFREIARFLHFEEDGYAPRKMSKEWIEKHKPEAGGYYVQYEDGYESYSPAEPFESGYTLIQ